MIRDLLRTLIPQVFIDYYRTYRKGKRNRQLIKQQQNDQALQKDDLIKGLVQIGLKPNDDILVHASLSSIGYIAGGAATLIEAFTATIGQNGNLLMPTSPNPSYQYEYVLSDPIFDVNNTASQMGKLSETFRMYPGVQRSLHPTESVACFGSRANWYVNEHHLYPRPYGKCSPFYRLAEQKGKIVLIGVSLTSCTSLHVLEDVVDTFKFPVYINKSVVLNVIDSTGKTLQVETFVHNPEQSKKRRCNDLFPMFELNGVLTKGKLGEADVFVLDAAKMLETMIKAYNEYGVTMYTPFGDH